MKTIDNMRTLDTETRQLLLKLKELLQRHAPNATLFLYGSAARGERGPESDYDVLVLLETPLTEDNMAAIQDAVYAIELEFGIVISLAFYTLDEWNRPLARLSPYHQAVEREAIRL